MLIGTRLNNPVWAYIWAVYVKDKFCPWWTVHLEFSPGGVHASTEDWTNTDRLLEGIGIFLSLYFAKAAWTASVCKSKRTEQRLATAKNERVSFKSLRQYGRWLPDLKRSSRVLAGRDLLCLELGRTAWEDVWILLSICREGSTPADKENQNKLQTKTSWSNAYQYQKYEHILCILWRTCFAHRETLSIAQADQVSTSLMVIANLGFFLLI